MLNPYIINPIPVENVDSYYIERKDELKMLDFYFKRTFNDSLNSAILIYGERGSGKTSLLNLCENKSKIIGFMPVRLELDDRSSTDRIQFMYELFHSIVISAFDPSNKENYNKLSKIKESTDIYTNYLSLIIENVIIDNESRKIKFNEQSFEQYSDSDFTYTMNIASKKIPFEFPFQYSYYMQRPDRDKINHVPSLTSFIKDVNLICDIVESPLIFLLDECNMENLSDDVLDVINNMIENVKKCVLVISGTEKFYDNLKNHGGEVLCKLRYIHLKEIENSKVKDFILKPWSKIESNKFLKPENFDDGVIDDIIALARNKPYIIQYLCHTSCKRNNINIKINFDSINDIIKLNMIEETQKIRYIKGLSIEGLWILCLLIIFENKITTNNLFSIINLFYDFIEEKIVKKLIDELIKNEILLDKTKLNINLNATEKTITKYYIISKKIINEKFDENNFIAMHLWNKSKIFDDVIICSNLIHKQKFDEKYIERSFIGNNYINIENIDITDLNDNYFITFMTYLIERERKITEIILELNEFKFMVCTKNEKNDPNIIRFIYEMKERGAKASLSQYKIKALNNAELDKLYNKLEPRMPIEDIFKYYNSKRLRLLTKNKKYDVIIKVVKFFDKKNIVEFNKNILIIPMVTKICFAADVNDRLIKEAETKIKSMSKKWFINIDSIQKLACLYFSGVFYSYKKDIKRSIEIFNNCYNYNFEDKVKKIKLDIKTKVNYTETHKETIQLEEIPVLFVKNKKIIFDYSNGRFKSFKDVLDNNLCALKGFYKIER